MAHPPAPIRHGNKKPSAAAKGKAKAKAKAKSKAKPKKRVCSETPPKTASFKRGKKRHLSPMALKMLAPTKAMRLQKDSVKEALTAASDMAEAEPADPAETANPAALPAAEPAEPAETAEPSEQGYILPSKGVYPAEHKPYSVRLAQVRESIKLLGVPEELLPQSVPKGSGSYTIKHPQHQAAVQVLHARRVYFLTWDRTGAKPPKQTWAWAKHDGAKIAWDLAKKALAW